MAGYVMPNADLSSGINMLAQGLGDFRARRDQNALAAALPRAMAGDQNALAQLAQASPQAYLGVQNQLYARGREEKADKAAADKATREQQLQGLKWGAGAIVGATPEQRPQIYATQVLPRLKALGFTDIPEQYDQSVEATANSILERFPKLPGEQENKVVPAGGVYVSPDGTEIYSNPREAVAPVWQPPSGYTGGPGGLTAIPGGPEDPSLKVKEPKPLPNKVIEDLGKRSAAAETMDRLVNTFKDEYGGNWAMGGVENKARLLVGDDTGQGQWWQDYAMEANQMRNDLFGSALTAPEKAAFEAATITPDMNSGEIKKNLARQKEAADKALQKLVGASRANWKNDEAIEAATGGRGFNASPAPPPGGATVVDWNDLP